MNKTLKNISLLTVAMAIASSSLIAQEEVLHIDLNLFADFNYDVDTLNVKEYVENQKGINLTDHEFENDYPIFEGAANYDVYGFGSFEYDFGTLDVAPTFDLGEKYDWEFSILGDWGYYTEVSTDNGTVQDSDFGNIDIEFPIAQTSVSEVTFSLTGLSPQDFIAEIVGFFAPLPSSGTFADLITAINSIHGLGLGWPLVSIDPSDIEYDASFDMQFGYVDVALNDVFSIPNGQNGPVPAGPIDTYLDSLLYANAGFDIDIQIKASRQNQSVPDTGSTAILALFGFVTLFAAKRRLNR